MGFEDVSFATKALKEFYGTHCSTACKGGIAQASRKTPLEVRTEHLEASSPSTCGALIARGRRRRSLAPPESKPLLSVS